MSWSIDRNQQSNFKHLQKLFSNTVTMQKHLLTTLNIGKHWQYSLPLRPSMFPTHVFGNTIGAPIAA
jgi:hypothetical protein